jgi:GNAT superfamily N-acetyltransferase
MVRILESLPSKPLVCNGPITSIDSATLEQQPPLAHYLCVDHDELVARCSIWISDPGDGQRPNGIIGHYAAADQRASDAILGHAIDQLKLRGCKTAIGPMDGNTWRRYRLLTHRGTEPAFFLEPENPDAWPGFFRAMGFTPLAEYFSSLNADLTVIDPRVPAAMERLSRQGIRLREIRLDRLDDELKAVHELSLEAFAKNFLYSPITQQQFLDMYRPLYGKMRSELVLMAEDAEQRLVGFVFGVPDFNQAKLGQPITRAICKTVAVRPGRAGAGLGSILIDRFQQAARGGGFTSVIHALMHEGNQSMKIASRFGTIIRRYTLFARNLES